MAQFFCMDAITLAILIAALFVAQNVIYAKLFGRPQPITYLILLTLAVAASLVR